MISEAEAGACVESENEVEFVDGWGELKINSGWRKFYGTDGNKYVNEHINRDKLSTENLRIIVKADKQADQ